MKMLKKLSVVLLLSGFCSVQAVRSSEYEQLDSRYTTDTLTPRQRTRVETIASREGRSYDEVRRGIALDVNRNDDAVGDGHPDLGFTVDDFITSREQNPQFANIDAEAREVGMTSEALEALSKRAGEDFGRHEEALREGYRDTGLTKYDIYTESVRNEMARLTKAAGK